MPGHLRLHEEFRREDRVPLDRLVVGTEADLALTPAGGEIAELRCIVALGAVASRGGIPEEGEIDLVAGRRLPGDLQRVVVGPARPVESVRGGWEGEPIGGVGRPPEPRRQPLVEHRHSGLRRRESRVVEAVGAPAVDGGHGIEGEEVEQLVLLDRPPHREGEIVDIFGQGVGGTCREIDRCIGRSPAARRGVPGDAPLEVVGARLDDGVDDPSEGLAVLRLEAAGLDLDLVQKLAGHAGAQGAVHDVVRADPPEPGIRDVDAVDQIRVLQAGRAADRIVALTGAEAAHDTWRDRVGVGERSAERHGVREIVVFQAGSGGGRGGVDERCRAPDCDALGLARLESEIERQALVQRDGDITPNDRREPAGGLDAHGVRAGTQERNDVPAVRVGGGGARAGLRHHDDDRTRDRPAGEIDHLAGDRARRQLLRGEGSE